MALINGFSEFDQTFMEMTGGMTVLESIERYYEATGQQLTPEFVEKLFSNPTFAFIQLTSNKLLHTVYRGILNGNVPSMMPTEGKGYRVLSAAQSALHDPENNYKVVFGNNGNREAVYDKKTGRIVSDAQYVGTFNFFGPDEMFGHLLADMLPYFVHGN